MTGYELLISTNAWGEAYPEAVAGVLAMRNVRNPETDPALDELRQRTEQELRDRFRGLTRDDIRRSGVFPAYDAYYRKFGQTYHVLMQVESIALKGKKIPNRAALVESAFIAEVTTGLLTASHDLSLVALPVTVDVARGHEKFVLYNGAEQICKTEDMFIRDGTGILSAILHGPAAHARITPATTSALFCVYAPPGIGESAVREHLVRIESNIRLFASNAETIGLVTVAANG